MNVSRIIKRPLKETPQKTAIIFEDRRISYAELDSLIDRDAAGFLKLGLHQGDVFSLFLPSLPELIIGYLGAVRAGLVVNVVNALLKEQEVGYILKDCSSRAVLVDAARRPIIEAIRSEVKSLTTVIPIEDSRKNGGPSLMNILKESGSSFDDPGTKGSDTCHLLYTSGTTGWPKGVMATQQVFDAEGWFHSGDIAYMDEEGYAYIVDRLKDMINVGGEKVFPSEVEDMMLAHPRIKDVVVIGIADELKGEAPKAFIQIKESETVTAEEIRAFCKAKMAPYKVPVAVEFIDEIPRSAAGKALRRLLRDKEKVQ